MGPKKGKDIQDDNYWRTCIEEAPLDDENWNVKVVLVEAAGSDQDRIYLSKFETFAAEEKRFVIKNICKTETVFMINQLGGEKKIKDDNLRVFEEGQAYIKDKKDIPPDIQALIIKHLILKMKEEYLFIKRQRLEVSVGMRRESATIIGRAEVRGTVNVKPPEPLEPPPLPPKTKVKKEPDPVNVESEPVEGKKYNTQLRVRGEEWRDKVYVDDFPTDGPNLYVAVTGFVEPCLAGCLIRIGVPLCAIVQVKIDPTNLKVPSSLFRATKRGQSQTELLIEKSLHFWEDLQLLRIHRDSCNDYKNIAFIVFSPPYWDTENLSGNPDKIYDELCYLMYDVQDLTRQHMHYLNNMDIFHIPEEKEDARYHKFYNQSINGLPLESVTIFSVLDSILQTVCKTEEFDEKSTRSSLSTALTLNHRKSDDQSYKIEKAVNLVSDVFDALCITEAMKKSYRVTYGDEYESHSDPIVIHHGDFVKMTTFHLGNINLDNIVWSTLIGMPIHNLWQNQQRPIGEIEAKNNFHVNVLLSCFEREDVETTELNRLLNILACRKLYNNRSSLKKCHLPSSTISDFKKVYLKRSVLAEPLPKCPSIFKSSGSISPSFPSMTKSENSSNLSWEDDPEVRRIKFLFDCPDISELISAAEIANDKPIDHLIDDYELFEEFTGISSFQIMRDAFNKFNCVDYKYCEVTDCIIMMFFNSHDKDGIAREEWRCHLPTPLCLQDFFDFILEEHYDWIQREEKIYDEKMMVKSQSESKDVLDPLAVKSCIENTDVEMELLMEGSLKHKEIAQLEEETSPETTETNMSSKKPTSVSYTAVDSKSSRKAKSPTASTPKNIKASVTSTASLAPIDIPKKNFSGYDLGDRRVEVFGKDAIFFSKDGTRVSSMYTLVIPMNLEYIILNVTPGNGKNEFWFHKALGEYVTPEVLDTCESFRITSKDEVLINIKKQTYQVPIPVITISSIENPKRKESFMFTSEKLNNLTQIFETRSFHSLFVTWPNGLITETVYDDNSSILSHIKQYNVSPLSYPDEEMRCITLNGEVLIFRSSGIIEVLRPDSTYIKITKYEKNLLLPEVLEEPSETSSDKSRKAKGKDKPKDKPSKTSTKSSKNILQDDDKVSEEKPPVYELVIEEFEYIEANGLKQKWTGDIPYDIEKLLIRTATDYCLREVFSRRMDGTNILLNKDGVQIVTFPDGTRVITTYIIEEEEIYPEWTDEEKEYLDMFETGTIETETKSKVSVSQKSTYSASIASSTSRKIEEEETKERIRTDGYISVQIVYSVEHLNFTTVTIDKSSETICIDSPNNTSVTVDKYNHYDIVLDNVTTAKFNGENLVINYEACPECNSTTNCKIKVTSKDKCSATKIHQNWLKMKDSFCKKIIVNEEGSVTISNEQDSSIVNTEEIINPEGAINANECDDKSENNIEEKPPEPKSETSVSSHGKCREMYLAKTIKFFVLRRDLACSELVHRAILEEYKRNCCWQPWCSISNYDTFGDHRSLLSIMMPVHLTEAEKWLMDSKFADKPQYLVYKDLKKDCGKGFYHWMRPYERFKPTPKKPDNALPPRLPRAFVMRTLELQWAAEKREELKGAKELLNAILRYRRVMESDSETILHVPIIDPRPEDERRIDDIIQALAHRIYVNLKARLTADVTSRAKAAITTKHPPPPEEMSVEGEFDEECADQKALDEERESDLKECEAAEEMSPNLKRYWRRRAEEYKEEQFYIYLLRKGSVPPYFHNVLGGAMWWEMNSTADEAVTKAERKKTEMKCTCAQEEATVREEDTPIPFI